MSDVPSARVISTVATAGAVGGLVGLLTWWAVAFGDPVRPWLIIALAVTSCMLAAGWALLVRARFDALAPVDEPPQRLARLSDRERGGLERVERRIAQAMADPGRFDDGLRRWLTELAEHRLRRGYGVELRAAPQQARQLLGESLWQVTATTTPITATRQELSAWVHRIESL